MESSQQRHLFCLITVSLFLTLSSPAADIQIRLAGSGSTQCSGRIEIYHNNIWGTVCDDEWDLNDAEVVCRQLGCGTALRAPQSAHFGEGNGRIWLDEVDCSGSERSLTECQHRGFGRHNCGHGEDAGVVCSVPLQQPSISLTSPNRGLVWGPEGAEVTRGYSFIITCSINSSYPGGVFSLIFSGSNITDTKPAVNHSASFNFPVAEYEHQGIYSCVYEVTLSSRKFTSPETATMSVTIKLPLQQPSISLTSPNRGLVWGPEGAEVTRGYSFIITCSINSSYPGGVFSLIFSGSNITDTKPAVNHSASFNFPVAEYEHQGNYSCVYEVTLSSRKFTSPETATMSVTIKYPTVYGSIIRHVTVLFILLLVNIILYFCYKARRGQKKSSQQETTEVDYQNLDDVGAEGGPAEEEETQQ